MTTNFISVEEFKTSAPDIDLSRYPDTTISGMINRATARAESYINYSLPYEVVANEKSESYVDADMDLVIFTQKRPVRTVVSVSLVKAQFSADLTLTSGSDNIYDITKSGDRIVIPGSTVALNTVSLIDFNALRGTKFFTNISYGAGFYMYDRPADIIFAICLLTREELSRTYNPTGASRITQGAVTIEYSNTGRTDGKSDLVVDAENVLRDYKRVSGW